MRRARTREAQVRDAAAVVAHLHVNCMLQMWRIQFTDAGHMAALVLLFEPAAPPSPFPPLPPGGISSPEPKLPQLVDGKANAASFDAESAPLSTYMLQVGHRGLCSGPQMPEAELFAGAACCLFAAAC